MYIVPLVIIGVLSNIGYRWSLVATVLQASPLTLSWPSLQKPLYIKPKGKLVVYMFVVCVDYMCNELGNGCVWGQYQTTMNKHNP